MLTRVFEFSQLAVRQVMVPRTEMIAIPVDMTYRQLLALSARERHTRLPVYEGNPDNIVGVLYLRDFLAPTHWLSRHRSLAFETS